MSHYVHHKLFSIVGDTYGDDNNPDISFGSLEGESLTSIWSFNFVESWHNVLMIYSTTSSVSLLSVSVVATASASDSASSSAGQSTISSVS